MRTTRIEIEGPGGEASIERKGADIIIEGSRVTKVIELRDGRPMPISKTFRLVAGAIRRQQNWDIARRLNEYIEGRPGTNSEIIDYLRLIETFEG